MRRSREIPLKFACRAFSVGHDRAIRRRSARYYAERVAAEKKAERE